MPFCPQCGQTYSVHERGCPDCSRTSEPVEPQTQGLPSVAFDVEGSNGHVAIARFQNGAEAGYFADELARETGFATEVLARERFDAVHAGWSVDYILLVGNADAEAAARMLKTLVEMTSDDDPRTTDQPAGLDVPGGAWVPLILTLAAGSIACFGIERLDQRPRPPALVVRDGREPPELQELIGAARGTWVQRLDRGGGVRELTLDPDSRSALLKEDDDGDGRFEREWEFSWRKH